MLPPPPKLLRPFLKQDRLTHVLGTTRKSRQLKATEVSFSVSIMSGTGWGEMPLVPVGMWKPRLLGAPSQCASTGSKAGKCSVVSCVRQLPELSTRKWYTSLSLVFRFSFQSGREGSPIIYPESGMPEIFNVQR